MFGTALLDHSRQQLTNGDPYLGADHVSLDDLATTRLIPSNNIIASILILGWSSGHGHLLLPSTFRHLPRLDQQEALFNIFCTPPTLAVRPALRISRHPIMSMARKQGGPNGTSVSIAWSRRYLVSRDIQLIMRYLPLACRWRQSG